MAAAIRIGDGRVRSRRQLAFRQAPDLLRDGAGIRRPLPRLRRQAADFGSFGPEEAALIARSGRARESAAQPVARWSVILVDPHPTGFIEPALWPAVRVSIIRPN